MHYRETSLLIFLFCLLNYDLVHCAEERRVMRDLQGGEQNCTSAACPGISIHCPATSCFEVLKCNSLSPSGYYWIRTSSCVQRMYCKMEKITCNFPGSCAEYPAESCRSIFECDPLITSGDYWIKTSSSPQQVYCDMDTTACGVRGVMRIAYLDTSVSDTCPSNLTKYEVNGTIMCGRHNRTVPCDSVYYPSRGVEYSNICGRAVGYSQKGIAVCGFWWSTAIASWDFISINDLYVSGVTITRGPCYDRTHVWTYAAGHSATVDDACNCPCAPNGTAAPSFVGNNYFCESATKYEPPVGDGHQWYTNYTLWQGNCYEGSNCCPNDGRPWFNVALFSPTNQDIEVRWCGYPGLNLYGNVATEILELFVY